MVVRCSVSTVPTLQVNDFFAVSSVQGRAVTVTVETGGPTLMLPIHTGCPSLV